MIHEPLPFLLHDRERDIETEKQRHREIDWFRSFDARNKKTQREKDGEIDTEKGRVSDRQIDRQRQRHRETERESEQVGHAGAGIFHDDAPFLLHVPSRRWSRCRPVAPPPGPAAAAAGPGPRGWFASARLPPAAPAAAAGDSWGTAGGEEERVAVFGGLTGDNARLGDGWVCHVHG